MSAMDGNGRLFNSDEFKNERWNETQYPTVLIGSIVTNQLCEVPYFSFFFIKLVRIF